MDTPVVDWVAVVDQLATEHVSRLAVDASIYRAAWKQEQKESQQLREMLQQTHEQLEAVTREYREVLEELRDGN